MRNASGPMKIFLATRAPFFIADLFTLTLIDGTKFYWTSASANVTYGGITWIAAGPTVTRSSWEVKNTIDVPQMVIQLLSNGADFPTNNLKLLIHDGLLNGSQFLLERAIMPTFGDTSLGLIILFQGQTSSIKLTAIGAEITVKGANVLLQQYMPRNKYMLPCIHALYDAGCTLHAADFTETMTVSSANTTTLNWVSGPANPSYYIRGVAVITSGLGAGQRRSIELTDGAGAALSYPLYIAPLAGDTFDIIQGCAKTQDACLNQFNNIQHYRGFPYIPPAETAL